MAIYKDTIGLTISFTADWNISVSEGTLTIEVRKPNGGFLTWTPTIDDGPNGACHYDTVDGDLDIAGTYNFQGKWAATGGDIFYTNSCTFDVDKRV